MGDHDTPPQLVSSEPDQREDQSPAPLPARPGSVSRIDTVPEDFVKLLSRRPCLTGDVLAERYQLVQHLDDGAMGQVFVAENRSIGVRVAIKVLRPELLADGSFRRRFQQEAEAIAAIHHRNVVRFLDLVVADPTFLVMEYVPGPTLAAVLKEEGALAPARALHVATRLCWGLEAAHRAGIVHRDVKPANVILAPDPELGEEPKLIDFGLAKLAVRAPEDQLTRAGQIVGTPLYMSPEQIANRDVDARSDVYSLGCLIYHMVAGRPPFAGSDDVQIMYQQLHGEPPPLALDAPRGLDAVLKRALAKDPDARFASMRELAHALGRVDARRAAKWSSLAAGDPDERTHEIERLDGGGGRGLFGRLFAGLGLGAGGGAGAGAGAVRGAGAGARRWLPLALVGTLGLLGGAALYRFASPLGSPSMTSDGVNSHSQNSHSMNSDTANSDAMTNAAAGAVLVSSRPAGATVELDGHALPETTPTIARGLAPGRHTVRVAGTHHAPVEQVVTLGAGERVAVDVALPPASRAVEVQTVPAGALVFLDGHLAVGQSPLHLEVTADDFHELRLEKSGYEPLRYAITPENEKPVLSFQLEEEKQARGMLWVDANRAAQVFLDGADSGLVTPTLGIRVRAGEHTVQLRDGSGAVGASARVKVARGENVHLTLDFAVASARRP